MTPRTKIVFVSRLLPAVAMTALAGCVPVQPGAGFGAGQAVGQAQPVGQVQPVAATACPSNPNDGFVVHQQLTCFCGPVDISQNVNWVYGTDIYTADSDICPSAVHAGAITTAGGTVTIIPRQPRYGFVGSTRNGIASHGFDGTSAAYYFVAY